DFAGLGLLASVQASPQLGVGWIRGGEPARDWREDLIASLALLDLPAELLPLLVPGHIRRRRVRHAAGLECGAVLRPDEQDIVEAAGPEPGGERQGRRPVLTGDQQLHGARQFLVQLVELDLPRLAGLLPHRHRPASSRWAGHRAGGRSCTCEVRQEHPASRDGQRTNESVGWPPGTPCTPDVDNGIATTTPPWGTCPRRVSFRWAGMSEPWARRRR